MFALLLLACVAVRTHTYNMKIDARLRAHAIETAKAGEWLSLTTMKDASLGFVIYDTRPMPMAILAASLSPPQRIKSHQRPETTTMTTYLVLTATRTVKCSRFTTDAGETWWYRYGCQSSRVPAVVTDALAGRPVSRGGGEILPEHYRVIYHGTDWNSASAAMGAQ